MEVLLISILFPVAVIAALLLVCWIQRGRVCRSTAGFFRSFLRDTRGQDLVEISLFVGFVALAAAAVMPSLVLSVRALVGNETAVSVDWVRRIAAVIAALFLVLVMLRRRRRQIQ